MEIVHDIPEGAPIINIEGKRGESLFYRPVMPFIEKEFSLISKQFERYKKLVEEAKEERLLALIGAMSMEKVLELLLEAYIPDCTHIKDFILSQKIELARSLQLIPAHIFDAAVLINSVRNKFVHELEIDCFDSLDSGTQDSLKQKYRVFFPNDRDAADSAVKNMFIGVVECVVLGLRLYTSQVLAAKEYIYSGDFRRELNKRIKDKSGQH